MAETPEAPTTIEFDDKGKVTKLVYETCTYTLNGDKGEYVPQ